MNADDPDSRRVQWTQPARQDMKFLVDRRGFTRAAIAHSTYVDDTTLARAVCRVWLAWKEGQK